MDGNPSMRGPSEPATRIARADYPHLSAPEWEALQRLATVIGEAAVATMLRTLSPTEQHGVTLDFIVKEQRDAAAATTTTASSGTTPRVQSLKLHVSNYVGKEGEPLFRWLVEVDTAIAARRIFDDPSKVHHNKQWRKRRRYNGDGKLCKLHVEPRMVSAQFAKASDGTLQKWHERLAHISYQDLLRLADKGPEDGICNGPTLCPLLQLTR
ncbi:hypothetical protein PC123_g19001 [Phytophthora cactorum]|nr:hypothetical protein PC123_g19001 [Phytophthora cactorum]